MRSIAERELCVVIPLLAGKIREMTDALRVLDALRDRLADAEMEARADLQETLEAHCNTLDSLRAEYESAIAEGINLPSYEQLTRRFALE